jgi:hypothetical protein
VNAIQETIDSIKLPHSINRRNFELREFSTWKASEMRTFFLYLAFPCLLGKLKYKYMIHLYSLITAVRMLHVVKRGKKDIKSATKLIDLFKKHLIEYYGNKVLTHNMHIFISHFVDDTIKHGSQSQHSMFSFESSLGYFKRTLNGNRGLHSQFITS